MKNSIRNAIAGGLVALVSPFLVAGCQDSRAEFKATYIKESIANPSLVSVDQDGSIRQAYSEILDEKKYNEGLSVYNHLKRIGKVVENDQMAQKFLYGRFTNVDRAMIGYQLRQYDDRMIIKIKRIKVR